jgi:PKD repeat protein
MTYKWYFDDGITSTQKDPQNVYTNPKTYNVKLVAISASGCKDSVTKTVTLLASPVVKFGPQTNIVCTGRQIVMIDSTSFGANYSWDFGDGSALVLTKAAKHVYSTAGTYTVKLKVTSTQGCPDSTTRTIKVTNPPVPGFTAPSVCIGNSTQFTNTSTVQPGATDFWRFGDGSTSPDKDPVHTYAKVGSFSVSLKVVNAGGCIDSSVKTVVVNPAPPISFSQTKLSARKIQFTPSDTNYASYKWTFGDNDSSTDKSPAHTYNVLKGKFYACLDVVNSQGCKANFCDSVCIGTDCGVGIEPMPSGVKELSIYPNPFTNSTLVTFELEKRSNVKVELYDMLGRKMATLDEGARDKGQYQYEVNAGKYHLSQGMYLLQLTVDKTNLTREIIYNK